ncbi:hypothetical protein CsatB_017625 [Cannabis sativa]|uniref:uncharacterized protein LOC115710495 n=1 Tax=Cannabis sativa TaxID=3483 RepID=UPI0029CAA4B5|nr:uncharacterized protein LOC115710495 [Cannabis sativa]
MRWHYSKRPKEDDVIRHPADAEEWKHFDRRHPSFALEPRNVRLGLATDWFNPFGNMSNAYSVWPVILVPYNLPLWKCMKLESLMLSLLVLGRTASGKDMNVFMRPLIDGLRELWDSGVQARDAYNGTVFTLRAAILWTINDFSAYAMMSGWSTKGYKACPTYKEHTPSIGLHIKIGYVGHRRFLEMDDARRRSKKYDGKIEKRPPPPQLLGDDILAQLEQFQFRLPGKHKQFGGVKGKRSFPDGFTSNLEKNVNETEDKIFGLKSHDFHVLLQCLMPGGIRKFFKKEVRDTITEFCVFFQKWCCKTLNVTDLQIMQKSILDILCKLETIFPPAFFDIIVHLVMHLPKEAMVGGPMHFRWMYPIERAMSVYKQYVKNRSRPEGSISEAYAVNEALTFCSMYFRVIETRFNREDRNSDVLPNKPEREFSIFKHVGRPIGQRTIVALPMQDKLKAEWYILNNLSKGTSYNLGVNETIQENEFPSWFKSRINQLRADNPAEVSDELYAIANPSNPTCYCYPGCIVNGIKFLVEDRDENRKTQNSGILNGVDWNLVNFYTPRNVWDFLDEDDDETTTIQERNSSGISLVVQLPQLDDV